MNKLILTLAAVALAAFALAAFVGQPLAQARGTGGAHKNEPKHGEPSHASQPHSNASHSNEAHSNTSHNSSQHPSSSQAEMAHNSGSGANHSSQVGLPTDAGFGASPSKSSGKSPAAGAAVAKSQQPQTSGAKGAAAGAAATKSQQPQTSGAKGAATGAAVAKSREPQASGAQGAAAGAAVAKNREPQASGAQGAAAGAAVAKSREPQVSGAAGAAAGAAAAKNREPQYSGAEGAAAGAALASNRQPEVSGAAGAAAGYAAGTAHRTTQVSNSVALARGAAVRNNFNHPDVFGAGWYGAHPNAWHPAAWAAGATWSAPAWPAIGAWYGWGSTQPINYDYGNSVVYQGDQVYSDGQPIASANEYYQTAATLAQSASAADLSKGEWLPLGVFAVVQGEQTEPSKVFELAIDKSGAIAGNFNDLLTDTTLPIRGAVDKKTQRAAWTVGESKHNVWNTGLANLTKDQAPALVHFGKDKTQQWMLVRLKQPAGGAQ